MTSQLNVYEAKAQLSALLSRVESGEEFVIARNGRPIARLTQLSRTQAHRMPGTLRGRITMSPEFESLDEGELGEWYAAPIEPTA